jgi:hypothetical protein
MVPWSRQPDKFGQACAKPASAREPFLALEERPGDFTGSDDPAADAMIGRDRDAVLRLAAARLHQWRRCPDRLSPSMGNYGDGNYGDAALN